MICYFYLGVLVSCTNGRPMTFVSKLKIKQEYVGYSHIVGGGSPSMYSKVWMLKCRILGRTLIYKLLMSTLIRDNGDQFIILSLEP